MPHSATGTWSEQDDVASCNSMQLLNPHSHPFSMAFRVTSCHNAIRPARLLAGTRPSQEHPTGQNELREQGHATSAQEGRELSVAQVMALLVDDVWANCWVCLQLSRAYIRITISYKYTDSMMGTL